MLSRILTAVLGVTAAIGVAVACAAEAGLGRVRLLKWDREAKDYYVVALDLLDRAPVAPEVVT